MFIKQFLTGGDRNFGYVVADDATRRAVLIDPSYSPEQMVRFAQQKGYEIDYVLNTHRHFDHTNGNDQVERLTRKRPLSFGEQDPETGEIVGDEARLPLGDLEIRIIHTPGHTDDCICIHVGDAVFTGDTLFVGKVGGTDFRSGARAEYEALHKKLLALPDSTRVFPGHNYGTSPSSTIGHERLTNPFLVQPDFESFVHLKKNWTAYKEAHGIA